MLPETLLLRLELMALSDLYGSILDNDRLEEWPGLFVDDCLYEIIPRENEEMGLPAAVMLCDNIRMLRDRVVALRHANIYEKVAYRHMVSGLEFTEATDGSIAATSSYVVVNTSLEGFSAVYQAGSYRDIILRTASGLRYKSRRCVFDTLQGADPARGADLSLWHDVAPTDAVADEEVIGVSVAGVAVALFRLGDEFHALHDLCTHGRARLSDGYVENGCIECPLHQGRIDIRDGSPRSAPITEPVQSFPVRVVGGRIEVLMEGPDDG